MRKDQKAVFVDLSPEDVRLLTEADDGPLMVIPAPGPVPEMIFFPGEFVEWPNFPQPNKYSTAKIEAGMSFVNLEDSGVLVRFADGTELMPRERAQLPAVCIQWVEIPIDPEPDHIVA